MKRLVMVSTIAFSLMASPCFAIEYCKDFLESGNAGGWSESLKTFEDEWTLNLGDEVELDIWINDVPEPLVSAGFWIDYDPSAISIVSVDTYDDNNDLPGPWDSANTVKIPDPEEPGTYFVLVANVTIFVAPDGDGDIIIGKVRFRCEAEGDTIVTISTIPHFTTIVGESQTIYDLVMIPNAITIHQIIDYCEGDFDNDGDQDGTDAALFKSDYGRGGYVRPCPSTTTTIPNGCPSGLTDCSGLCVDTETNENHCGGCDSPCGSGQVCIAGSCEVYCSDNYAPVAKTGQTTTYATGDDGDLEKGVPWPYPRFTDNGDGTVTDNLTGLIWLKDANCFGQRVWNDALSDANGLENGECGLTDGSIAGDWRVPNNNELVSLVDAANFDPALPSGHPFTSVFLSGYWSTTTSPRYTDYAKLMNTREGTVSMISKSQSHYLWPVRGGQ